MSLTNTDNKTAFPSDGEKKAVSQASEKSTPHEHEHGCCYHHEADHAEKSCGCGPVSYTHLTLPTNSLV